MKKNKKTLVQNPPEDIDIMKCLRQMKRRIDKGAPYGDILEKMRQNPTYKKFDDMLKNGGQINLH